MAFMAWRCLAPLGLWLAASGAMAQTPAMVKPVPLAADGQVEGELSAGKPLSADGKPYDCYAIDTRPGSRWTIDLSAAGFDPSLQIARGALCSAAALQHQNDNSSPDTKDARVAFTAAGGRYLIFVRGQPGSAGAYRLVAAPEDGSSIEQASSAQAPQTMAAIDRRALMDQQVSKRRAELAAQEAARQAAEAERQARLAEKRAAERARKEQNRAEFHAFLGAAIGAASEVTSQMAVENARQQAAAARQRAAQAAQAVAQQRAQQAAALRSQPAAPQTGGPGTINRAMLNGGGGGYGISTSPRSRAAQAAPQPVPSAQASSGAAAQNPSTAGLYKTTPQGTFMDHDAAIRAAMAAQGRGSAAPGPAGQSGTASTPPGAASFQQQQIAQAERNARLAQQRYADAQRQQQERAAMARTAAGNWSNGGAAPAPASSPTAPAAALLEWREGIAICESEGGKVGKCAGPQFNTFIGSLEERVNHVCQSKDWRELTGEKGYRIFACGYGIKPGDTSDVAFSHHYDWAKAKGLTVPGRRTFRCPSNPGASFYCRNS